MGRARYKETIDVRQEGYVGRSSAASGEVLGLARVSIFGGA